MEWELLVKQTACWLVTDYCQTGEETTNAMLAKFWPLPLWFKKKKKRECPIRVLWWDVQFILSDWGKIMKEKQNHCSINFFFRSLIQHYLMSLSASCDRLWQTSINTISEKKCIIERLSTFWKYTHFATFLKIWKESSSMVQCGGWVEESEVCASWILDSWIRRRQDSGKSLNSAKKQ